MAGKQKDIGRQGMPEAGQGGQGMQEKSGRLRKVGVGRGRRAEKLKQSGRGRQVQAGMGRQR